MNVFRKIHRKATHAQNKIRRKQMHAHEKTGISDKLRKLDDNSLVGPEFKIFAQAQKYWDEGREQELWDEVYTDNPQSKEGSLMGWSPGAYLYHNDYQKQDVKEQQAKKQAKIDADNAMYADAANNAYVAQYDPSVAPSYSTLPMGTSPDLTNTQSPDTGINTTIQQQPQPQQGQPLGGQAQQAQQFQQVFNMLQDPAQADQLATMLAMQMNPFDEKMFS